MEKNPLIGKNIKQIKIADDKEALLFILSDGEQKVRVDADCCSHTWIEHVELPTEFPCTVLAAQELELNKPPLENEEYECLQFYGYKLTTDKGDIVIDYRNSSNGYYGGSIVFEDGERFYGGVYGQNISSENWKELSHE